MDPNFTGSLNCSDISRFVNFLNDAFRQSRQSKPWEEYLITILYSAVSGFGAFANLVVISFMLKFRELRTLPNYFIMNLAVSDLLMCTVTAPVTLYMIHKIFWPFGDVTCRVMASAQALNIFVSTFTIAAIGVHRYCLTKYPLTFAVNYSAPVVGILMVWVISAGFAFPYGFVAATVGLTEYYRNITVWSHPSEKYQKYVREECRLPEPKMCLERYWSQLLVTQQSYTLACFFLQYFVPLLSLLFLYYKIGRKVLNRSRWRMNSFRANDMESRLAAVQRDHSQIT